MTKFEINVSSLSETEAAGSQIMAHLQFPACVYLNGEMGVGKTTLCKSIIKAFGYAGDVTSPTYNLIQEYPVALGTIYHMDLYRLEDASELAYLAIDDLWSEQSIFLIEWAERGLGYLQVADMEISISKSYGQPHENRQIILQKSN